MPHHKYRPKFDEQAYKLCLLGASDKVLAETFEVDEATINRWKHAHPTFFDSLKRGKITADAEVASALYKRALGYRYVEVSRECNKKDKTKFVTKEVHKEVPPDTAAAMAWLKNRRPEQWKEKSEIEIHGEKLEDFIK